LQLLIVGAVGALAAGNVVILKPSELAPEVAKVIGEFIPKYFPDGSVRVINGGADECTELLTYKFDKIMYTGSGRVGRIIARAAAEHLTPTILGMFRYFGPFNSVGQKN
jgi:aldehyde dehydrogenase (NAD+)